MVFPKIGVSTKKGGWFTKGRNPIFRIRDFGGTTEICQRWLHRRTMPSWYSTRTWNLWGQRALDFHQRTTVDGKKSGYITCRGWWVISLFTRFLYISGGWPWGFLNHRQYHIWAILPTANSWRPMKIGLIHPQKKKRIISQPSFFQVTFCCSFVSVSDSKKSKTGPGKKGSVDGSW